MSEIALPSGKHQGEGSECVTGEGSSQSSALHLSPVFRVQSPKNWPSPLEDHLNSSLFFGTILVPEVI